MEHERHNRIGTTRSVSFQGYSDKPIPLKNAHKVTRPDQREIEKGDEIVLSDWLLLRAAICKLMQADSVERPLLEPASTAPSTGETASLADENTPLIHPRIEPSDERASENGDSVPYKNIDGKRFWFLFAALLTAYLLAMFDSTLMATSHPVITSYFNASNAASWLTTVFYLTHTASQPLYGRISDTIGRRPVHLFGSVVFGLTTVWCGLAQSIGSLIAARALCGLGAGAVLTMTNVILADVIKIEYRGIFQSYVNVAYGLGNGLGAMLGGIICDHLGWRMAFGIQLPFICAFIVLSYFCLPSGLGPNLAAAQAKSTFEAFETFDFAGSALLVTTLTSLILGINIGGNILPWTHPLVLTALGIFVVTATTFILVERRAVRPVLPLSLLWGLPFGNLMWSNFLGILCANFVVFNFPLLIQAVWQASPTTSGLFLAASMVGGFLAAFGSGFFIQRTRKVKPTMSIGAWLFLVGLAAMTFLSQPGLPVWAIIPLSPWTSTGQGFLFPSSTVAALALCSHEDAAIVTTTQGLARNLGAIMGVAISSWILQNALPFYLRRTVIADKNTKNKIIKDVRSSISAIAKLEPLYKMQVISGYAQALRLTFAIGAVFAVLVIVLVLPLSFPRIQSSRDDDKPAQQADQAQEESQS